MKKIYRLSLATFIGPFVATFFISLFVLVMQFLWKYIDELAGKGLEMSVIGELLLYASANLIPMAIPLSILLSSIMTFGNMAENHELLAFKTTGVSLLRLMKPLTIGVIAISTGAFFFANVAVPKANLKFKSLLYSIKEQKPAMDIVPGAFYGGIEGFSIRVSEKDPDTDRLYDVMIYDKSENRGNVMVTRAEEGEMYITEDERFLILDLLNGARYHEMPEQKGKSTKTFPHNTLRFEEYQIRFDLSSFNFKRAKEELWKNSTQMMNLNQLSAYIDTTHIKIEKKMDYTKEYSVAYFNFLSDSSFAVSDSAYAAFVPEDKYISTIEVLSSRALIQRALSHARSIKGSLKSAHNELDYQLNRRIRGKIEFHRKFTLSIACILLFFVGAPLGAIIRKGGLGLPVVISTVIFILYYIVMIGTEKAAKQGAIYAEAGMWFPVTFILPFAFLLTIRANNDSKVGNFGGFMKGLFKKKNAKELIDDDAKGNEPIGKESFDTGPSKNV